MNYIEPEDVVVRLLKQKPYWFDGPPTIQLDGVEGSFGVLKFCFKDETINCRIYIKNRDAIFAVAVAAIENFDELATELYKRWG